MVMLVRCEGEDEEEVDNDEESSERLMRGLTHQCSLTLNVQGLSTGYCKDIHGQVRWLICLVLYREKQVKASYEKENSLLKCVCVALRWKCVGGDKATGSRTRENYFNTRSMTRGLLSLPVGHPMPSSKSSHKSTLSHPFIIIRPFCLRRRTLLTSSDNKEPRME